MGFELRKLNDHVGAEIGALDVRNPLSEADAHALLQAFYEYSVLLIRGQDISEAEQVEFTKYFGTPTVHVLDQYLHAERREILIISNVSEGDGLTEGLDEGDVVEWHSDLFWHARPSIGSLLYAVAVPPVGGDTLFASMYAAYESLPEELVRRIEGRFAVRSLDRLTEMERKKNPQKPSLTEEQRRNAPPVSHPLIRKHPVTGRRSLFVSEMSIHAVDGMSEEESEALVEDLIRHSTQPELVYRHRWRKGDLLVWDNRCTIHTRTPGDNRYPRILYRTTLEGQAVLPAPLTDIRDAMAASDSIVITGIGMISPVGLGAQATFDALIEGRSGVRELSFDVGPECEVRIGAQVTDFNPQLVFGKKESRRQGRFMSLAIGASRLALEDSGLSLDNLLPERIAVVVGCGMGGVEMFAEAARNFLQAGPRSVSPFDIPSIIPNMAAGAVSKDLGAMGPSYCVASACASSGHALGDALNVLRRGDADIVFAGGTEACVTPLVIAGFHRMKALSIGAEGATRASRPFERDRDGFVLGEGATILVLERFESARRRGARVYAELAGYGASSDGYHNTRPLESGAGAAIAMTAAIRDAQCPLDQIGYINAHGTGTPHNDVVETRAIHQVFGSLTESLWVSSTKSMTGHLLGAAGALEAGVTAMALKRGRIPPTINFDNAGEGCDLDYVPNAAREAQVTAALSNSFGFGGHNSSVVLRSVDPTGD
jgi:3-oxoacyl-[acyl-carrier-protein] synthase II